MPMARSALPSLLKSLDASEIPELIIRLGDAELILVPDLRTG
jgi:hypothetical protein